MNGKVVVTGGFDSKKNVYDEVLFEMLLLVIFSDALASLALMIIFLTH